MSTPNDPVPLTPAPNTTSFLYADSVFYLQPQSTDYIVFPRQTQTGEYFSFPEGMELDKKTGAINVSKSETGLKYRVSFVPNGQSDTVTSIVLLSGINYLDGFYRLSTNDSIAKPVYNAVVNNPVPGINNGSIFDEGSGCNSNGCKVDVVNGQINLAQTVRNGVFGTKPANNARQEFELNYRLNDGSKKASNTLKIKLYYFDSMNDVTQEVLDIISSREGAIFRLYNPSSTGDLLSANIDLRISSQPIKNAKPRPPCIFIVKN